jgi:repressor LexA
MKDTEKALQVLKKYFIENKRLPSYRILATLMGYRSTNAVYRLMQYLAKKGYVKKDEDGTFVPGSLFNVPIKGTIPAGSPVFVESDLNDAIDMYQQMLNLPKDVFCLIVKGDSMIEAGIMEGDLAYINPQQRARIGDIVAALVDGDWTLKYLAVDEEGEIHLEPANRKYKAIYPKVSLTLGGVLIRTARDY